MIWSKDFFKELFRKTSSNDFIKRLSRSISSNNFSEVLSGGQCPSTHLSGAIADQGVYEVVQTVLADGLHIEGHFHEAVVGLVHLRKDTGFDDYTGKLISGRTGRCWDNARGLLSKTDCMFNWDRILLRRVLRIWLYG